MATNYAHGHHAEKVAADYISDRGYEILGLNWKTKWCEIDIIAKKDRVIYLIEVKYRKTNAQGEGLDYITPNKMKQMQFAADLWVYQYDWDGEYQLAAIEVSGDSFRVTNFVTEYM